MFEKLKEEYKSTNFFKLTIFYLMMSIVIFTITGIINFYLYIENDYINIFLVLLFFVFILSTIISFILGTYRFIVNCKPLRNMCEMNKYFRYTVYFITFSILTLILDEIFIFIQLNNYISEIMFNIYLFFVLMTTLCYIISVYKFKKDGFGGINNGI